MRKSTILAAILGSLVASGSAFAAAPDVKPQHQSDKTMDVETVGVVAAAHGKSDTITLADGMTFPLPGGVSAKDFKKGETVQVFYSANAGGDVVNVMDVNAL